MKKAFKIISIFIMLFTVFSGAFLINEHEHVEATENLVAIPTDGYYENNDYKREYKYNNVIVGILKITEGGEVTITYKYGYTELLIYAVECSDLTDDGTACKDGGFNGNVQIIHVSGDYARKGYEDENDMQSKTVHLFNYFDYDKIVKVSVIVSFATKTNYENPGQMDPINHYEEFHKINNTDFFEPLYCDMSTELKNCVPENFESDRGSWIDRDGTKRYEIDEKVNTLASSRVERFAAYMEDETENKKYTINYVDRKQLIYTGNVDVNNANCSCGCKSGYRCNCEYCGWYVANNEFAATDVQVLIDNTTVGDASSDVEDMIFDTIIPTLLVLLVIAAGVTTAFLGVKIIKGADEAQDRQEKIQALRNILIGVAVAFIILALAEPVTEFVKKWLE